MTHRPPHRPSRRPGTLLRWIAVAALVGCAGPMPDMDEGADPSGKPPGGKPLPQGAPAPDERLLPPPPEDLAPPPPPREEGCANLPIEGACEGSTAVWCEGGQRRSVNCAAVGRVCEFLGEEAGFYCGGYRDGEAPPAEPEPDPLPPPPEGEPEGQAPAPPNGEPEAPPPNGPEPEGAPPPNGPEPEGAPPPEGPEPEGAPAPPEGGEPEAPALPEPDADPEPGAPAPPIPDPEEGEGAPPPPGGAPEPVDVPAEGMACGDLSYHGTCAGSVVVYCHEDRVVHHTCPQGESCGWYDDEWGNWCVNDE